MFDFVALSSEKLGYFEFKVVVIYLICLDLPFRSSLKFSYGVFNMLNLYFFPLWSQFLYYCHVFLLLLNDQTELYLVSPARYFFVLKYVFASRYSDEASDGNGGSR